MTRTITILSAEQTRSATLSTTDGDERRVSLIAVPWDTETCLWDTEYEQFARGSLIPDPDQDPMMCWQHEEPIGTLDIYRDADPGLYVSGIVSRTAQGDTAYTLAKDGVITRASIRFKPIEWTVTERDDGTTLITHTRAHLREVSLVTFPAYTGAAITEVRSELTHPTRKEPSMGDSTATIDPADLDEVRATITDIDRRVTTLAAEGLTRADTPQGIDITTRWSSFGEFVKAVASGDEDATRAYTGITSGETVVVHGWLGTLIHNIREKQRVTSLFTHTKDLPREGMNLDTVTVKDDTLKVAKQTSEGDTLAFGELSFQLGSVAVETLGGYTSLSRQAIERSSAPVVDTVWTRLAIRYGAAVEAKVRAFLATSLGTVHSIAAGKTLAAMDQATWLHVILDLVDRFDATDYALTGLVSSRDVFERLCNTPAVDTMMKFSSTPDNRAGTVEVTAMTGDVLHLPITYVPGLAAGTLAGYNPFAIRTREDPAAPIRLQDDNVINLSRDMSVYGYATTELQDATALAAVTFTPAG